MHSSCHIKADQVLWVGLTKLQLRSSNTVIAFDNSLAVTVNMIL